MIGEGTKIDNLVQIAHNVEIGRHCVIAAHTGISGSCTIGDYVMMGGRVGIADNVTIGDGRDDRRPARGVMNDIPAGEKWGGAPAMPAQRVAQEAICGAARRVARARAECDAEKDAGGATQ